MSVDYAIYLKLNEWTGIEAICLVAGIDPEDYAERLNSANRVCKNRDLWNRVVFPINTAFVDSLHNGEIIAHGEPPDFYKPIEIVQWAISKRFDVSDELIAFVGQPETVARGGTQAKLKLQKQQEAILAAIKTKLFNPMAIPDGEKGNIKSICEGSTDLFEADTAFDRAWKLGIGSLWKMEHHESYARRGNA